MAFLWVTVCSKKHTKAHEYNQTGEPSLLKSWKICPVERLRIELVCFGVEKAWGVTSLLPEVPLVPEDGDAYPFLLRSSYRMHGNES